MYRKSIASVTKNKDKFLVLQEFPSTVFATYDRDKKNKIKNNNIIYQKSD